MRMAVADSRRRCVTAVPVGVRGAVTSVLDPEVPLRAEADRAGQRHAERQKRADPLFPRLHRCRLYAGINPLDAGQSQFVPATSVPP